MSVLEDFETAVGAAQKVVDGITEEQLSLPSPCSQWDVRAVLNHLVFGNLMHAAMAAGQPPPTDRTADYLGEDPHGAFLASVDAARTAFGAPGALEQIVRTPMGEQPASFLVQMRINELIAHGWDL